MKIAKFAVTAFAVVSTAFVLHSCYRPPVEEDIDKEPTANFTVALNTVEAEYAEVVVRHDGASDVAWYGFVTEDVTSSVETLIGEKAAAINRSELHVGTSQTVALRNLDQVVNYRYIAFAVNEENQYWGTAGSLIFNTSPIFDVTFTLEAAEVLSHEATFNVSHDGHEVLTYMGFLTEDMESEASVLAATNYASITTDGKLNSDVTLLNGVANTVKVEDLAHETEYRYIIYGIYDNNGVAIYYGTPAEVTFTTPIDLSIVNFSATVSNITKNSADVSVSYNAKQEDLGWYGFVTEDLTTAPATLIAEKVAGLSESDLNHGAGKISLADLSVETEYRYIVTGVNADGIYGIPAVVRFSSLSQAYDDTVFSVDASDVTAHGAKLTITHNGHEDFEYFGFFTDDLQSALADIPTPANADNNLMKGLENVVEVDNLEPLTQYRYIVTGRVYGNDYGKRGEVIFTTADNVVQLAYDDFIGEWKIEGSAVTISARENGISYAIDGFPGSSSTRGPSSTLVGMYDSENGLLYVEDQDVAQYDDPSSNNYGPLMDFFGGAVWSQMSDGSERYWPNYPFRSTEKNRVFSFVGLDDGTYELRPAEGVEATTFGWYILTGSYSGRGNAYSVNVELPASVTKVDKAAAAYADFLGNWNLGSEVITISQKTAGSTYSVTGLTGQDELYGNLSVITGNYDPAKHEFYIMEQKLGEFNTADHSEFGSNQYGDCDDYLSGYFPYNTSGYFAYPFNTDNPTRILTAYLNGSGEMEIIAGSCTYGTFSHFDFIWVIREGEHAGNGNNYGFASANGYFIPEKAAKASSVASASPEGHTIDARARKARMLTKGTRFITSK
ncbi:MAG: hypothetical protein IJS62_07745 [Bacteroidales bacterium]|nr:hypothetical protein [Bacteroidales bacterium]